MGNKFGKDSYYLDKEMGMAPWLESMSAQSLSSSSDPKVFVGQKSDSVGSVYKKEQKITTNIYVVLSLGQSLFEAIFK